MIGKSYTILNVGCGGGGKSWTQREVISRFFEISRKLNHLAKNCMNAKNFYIKFRTIWMMYDFQLWTVSELLLLLITKKTFFAFNFNYNFTDRRYFCDKPLKERQPHHHLRLYSFKEALLLTILKAAIHYASWRASCRAARILPHASWSQTMFTMLHTPNYCRSIIIPTTSPFKWIISNLF